MALPEDPAELNLDAWGLKRMMTLQIRRWISGAAHPKRLALDLDLNLSFGFHTPKKLALDLDFRS